MFRTILAFCIDHKRLRTHWDTAIRVASDLPCNFIFKSL